jgi:two-component sensor histidine kinase
LFAIAATALAPSFVILAYLEVASRQQRMAEVTTEALSVSRQAELEMARIVDGIGGMLLATSKAPLVRGAGAGCADVLKSINDGNESVASLSVAAPDGSVLCSTSPAAAAIHLGDTDYFRAALQTNTLRVGSYTKGRLSGEAVLPIALPVAGPDGKPATVLLAGLRISWLNARIAERGLEPGNALTIADRNGTIIARQPYPERFVGTRIPEPYLALTAAREPGVIEARSQDGTERILGYQPVATSSVDLYVSAGISKDRAFARINRTSYVAALIILAGAVLSVAAGWFVGNVAVRRPIRRIVDVVAAWRGGDRAARTGMRAEDGEIEQVGAALDRFLDELTRRQEQAERDIEQRRLLMHELGHRVKNTLSIAVSLANQMFRNASGDVSAYSQRLGALAGAYDLLLADDWNSADIRSVVEKALLPLIDDTADRLELDGPAMTLPSQIVLSLSLVLHELATNAVKYGAWSHPGGRVRVSWRRSSDDAGHITLTWRERDGPPVRPPEREGFGSKLLQRAFPSGARSNVAVDYAPEGLSCSIGFDIPTAGEALPLQPAT